MQAPDISKYKRKYKYDSDLISAILRREPGTNYSENFYREQILERYEHLIPFKEENETWKRFYSRMMDYIGRLMEQYQIPYIPVRGFNPENLYKNFEDKYTQALLYAIETGDKDLIEYLLNKGAKLNVYIFETVGRIGTVKLLELLLKYPYQRRWLQNTLAYAERYGNVTLAKYLKEKGVQVPSL